MVLLNPVCVRWQVLMSFDLDCCCVCYDGKDVLALPRACRALNGRFNLVDETRPNVKYEARLFKYSRRYVRLTCVRRVCLFLRAPSAQRVCGRRTGLAPRLLQCQSTVVVSAC